MIEPFIIPIPITTEARFSSFERAKRAAIEQRLDEAAELCGAMLDAEPDDAAVLALLGMVEAQRGNIGLAIGFTARALELRPGVPQWMSNLASLYRLECRMDEALRLGAEAMRLDQDNPDTLLNLSLVLTDLDRHAEAIALLVRAIGLNHDHPEAHLALAQNLLMTGNFTIGLREYEWRNLTAAGQLGPMPKMTSAPWNGMNLPGGKLLVFADQGFGDAIQFARYLPMIAERCDEILLGCSAELMPLLRRAKGVSRAFGEWTAVPGHAAHCRLSSAPYLLGTMRETIPAEVPYLSPELARIQAWGHRLDHMIPRNLRRIGIAWAGRPAHPNDRRRSLQLEALAPLGQAADVCFVPLHPTMTETDRTAFEALLRPALLLSDDQLHDFGETAALIANLDLVISVDTAVAHLAGAMGKRVWILLAQAADWRWMIHQERSAWYPTAQLYRQEVPGAWTPVIEAVARDLRNFR